jgi:hypothetical protein
MTTERPCPARLRARSLLRRRCADLARVDYIDRVDWVD